MVEFEEARKEEEGERRVAREEGEKSWSTEDVKHYSDFGEGLIRLKRL